MSPGEDVSMRMLCRNFALFVVVAAAVLMTAGCPLPFEFNGTNGGSAHSNDPSTPDMTAPATASYSVQGGASGSIPDGGTFVAGQTTTVTISTATVGAVIFYTTDGTTLTNLRTAQKFNASSGTFTISRTSTSQSLDIHAVAVGPNMLPSTPVHVTVSVSPYPIFTVTVDKTAVSEDGGIATFTVTASIAPTSDITVNLQTGSTDLTGYETGISAAPGTKFTTTLTHGTTSVAIPVTGVHNASTLSPTASLSVLADTNTPPAYTVGTPSSASFVLQDDGSHTVTYSGSGSTSGTAPVDNNSYVANAPVTVLGAGSLVKTGYTLAGWQVNGSGQTYAPNATFPMPGTNVTMSAVWNILQYTLTVTAVGNGTTSPAVPQTVTYGAATAITATPGANNYFVNWTVAAGSGVTFGSTGTATGTSPNDTVSLTSGNATVQANFSVHNYYVNVGTGSDTNAGTTAGAPFQTITKALSVATISGQTINVAPGTYNAATGETFPFTIPAGVSLIGDEATRGSSTIIAGGGSTPPYASTFISVTVAMGANTVLAGFTVTNINTSGLVSFPMGVIDSANNAIIRNNTIANSTAEGMYVPGGSGGAIAGNIIGGNGGGSGLAFVGGGGNGMSVSGNTFNDVVELDSLGPDLGGGAAGSPGGNSFLAVGSTYFSCGGTVMAMFNHWIHNPPTVGPVQSGFDVGETNTTVITTGYF
jgi:parallel beta-helix repeat protein